jgi:hypothetical protein
MKPLYNLEIRFRGDSRGVGGNAFQKVVVTAFVFGQHEL